MKMVNKLLDLEGFKKVDYVAREIHLTRKKLAGILELKADLISNVLDNGFVGDDLPEHDVVFERLYNITCLFSYLLNMSDYKPKHLQDIWRGTGFWDSARVKPPWYESGLKNYLFKERYSGLESCIEWIRKY